MDFPKLQSRKPLFRTKITSVAKITESITENLRLSKKKNKEGNSVQSPINSESRANTCQ